MYDRSETAAAYDRLWADIATRMNWSPAPLLRAPDLMSQWLSTDLALSQTCGLPYRKTLHDKVTYVGTPDYGLQGCPPGYYCSVIVVRADSGLKALCEVDGTRMAVNSTDSQSGYAAPLNAGLKPETLLKTQTHRSAAMAVVNGEATCAAIDAQTWRMIRKWDDFANDLMVLARTEPTPGLPLITAQADRVEDLRDAISAAIVALPPEDRETLNIYSLVPIPKAAYLAVPTPAPI